ncbi:RecX family transcriptional regulator [Ruminococcaceae bacterium OttesenSCG-928-A16]|nr:RecX family transcriptional regulator [Ruminococcaceae bacterium OttesenSCG-928-A16]
MSVTITRISQTKKGRFALFANDEFLFSVDDETLVKYGLSEGSLLTNEELSSMKDTSDIRKAKNQALRYLSLRAYAQQELYNKLCLKYDPHTAAAAVQDMCELDLLDDETFALEKAKGLLQRGKSSSEIRRQLNALGVDRTTVEWAVQAAGPNDAETAYTVLQKGGYIEKLRRGQRDKVMAALARRGFWHGDICRAVERAQQQLAEETSPEQEMI